MKQPFYIVIEDRQLLNGEFSPIIQHFIGDVQDTDPETGITRVLTAEARAWARFFTVCSAAAVSVIPYHAVHLLADNGAIVDMRVWDRRTEEPEEETPEEAPAEETTEETGVDGE